MKKLFCFILVSIIFFAGVSAQGGIQIGGTFFENNAGYDSENNVRSQNLGGAVDLYMANTGPIGILHGSLNARMRHTGIGELTGLAHFNLLWFFSPLSDIFVDPDRHLMLLAGSGLTFSNAFYNRMDIPFDTRISFKWDKIRIQTALTFYTLEKSYFETNSEFTISAYYTIFDWNK